MDQNKQVEEEPVTVLQGAGFYFDRLFLRESSPGQSFRQYNRDAQGVPFQWEMQPGTPKNLPEKEPVPPLTPPPALQGLGLPTPSCVEQPKDSNRWKPVSRLWKRCKKILFSEKFESSELCQCDGKFIASADNPSSEFSSSSMPCSDRHPSESPEFEKDPLHGPFVCSPSDITSVLVDRFLASKIMSRNSSAGQSSHLYYRLAEGVPFTWETMPGKSSEPVQQEAIPPPNPPPAVQGHSLPRPCFEQDMEAPPRLIWFWKRIRINFKLQKSRKIDNTVPLRFPSWDSSGSDQDFVSLLRDSSSSSSSSSSNSSSLLELSRSGKYSQDQSYGCTPWNVRAVLVGLGRRL